MKHLYILNSSRVYCCQGKQIQSFDTKEFENVLPENIVGYGLAIGHLKVTFD
jgi:hypothetical protein